MNEEIKYYRMKQREGFISKGELAEMIEITQAGWETVPFWISEYYVARINGMSKAEAELTHLS